MLETTHFETNGQTIHAMVGGKVDAPVMIMLHGFPEYWSAWESVAVNFASQFHVILPDQRGFNLSGKPKTVEDYDTKHMVADLLGIVDQVCPDRSIILCGHDWGASVAYAFAMRHHERVEKLIIANGVHPVCFQKALFEDAAQIEASQYMNILRESGSEDRLSRNDFSPLLNMFEQFSAAPWLNEDKKSNYRTAWRQPDALSSMLNWYRGSQITVPESGSPTKPFPITDQMREKYRIRMPHLLLWGLKDVALQPSTRNDLDQFCDDLHIADRLDGSHWILHEHPEWVTEQIQNFLTSKPK